MSQRQIQTQEQQLKQDLRLAVSRQQLLEAHLIELPLNEFVDRVNTEMNDNPALEIEVEGEGMTDMGDLYGDDLQSDAAMGAPSGDDGAGAGSDAPGDIYGDEDFVANKEREERRSALDDALASIGADDTELPVYSGRGNVNADGTEREEMVYGATTSFYDLLREQMDMTVMTDKQRSIMEYLIGSLDDDGFLRKQTDDLADELAIYQYVDATPEEIEQVIAILQGFDPVGIAARDLQECLLLQVKQRKDSQMKTLMLRVLTRYYDRFTRKRWEQIQTSLKISDSEMETLLGELTRLNPKPGASMGEVMGHGTQQITPDFIVDTSVDGTITFSVNAGDVPELQVSQSFADTMREYRDNATQMNRQAKEALLYTRQKVAAAQSFIAAMKTRRQTLTTTMRAIIAWQRRYFEDGDEASLRPMNLKDIAEKTGLDISTISRVSNSKYAQTRWGTFPLRHFFSDGYTTDSGEELSTRGIKAALKEVIDAEDKKKPLSDERLKDVLAERGFPIARRTVAKYREQMGIPTARLRK